MSAIFYSVTFTKRCSRVIPPGSHPRKPRAGFVLHLVCVPVQQLCQSGLICLVAMEESHSLLGPSSQLSSALINGKLSCLTLGWQEKLMGVNNSTRYMGINVFLLGGCRCNPLNILWNTRLIFFSIIYLRAFLLSLLAEALLHC